MPTRKIRDLNPPKREPCQFQNHDPPSMQVFEPGVYEHECQHCGNKQVFTVFGEPRL